MRHEFSFENLKIGLKNPKLLFDQIITEHFIRVPTVAFEGNFSLGTNIYEKKWDILILIDTCRIDALQEVAEVYDFLTSVGELVSVGASSPEWIARTFVKKYSAEIQNTAYLTCNGHAETILEKDAPSKDPGYLTHSLLSRFDYVDIDMLKYIEKLWRYEPVGETGPYGHPEGATPPRYVTERAIDICRNNSFNRIILHYHQPHNPYAARAIREDRELYDYETEFSRDPEQAWEAYLDELRYVLNDVELLLENVDADRVVISSDHGEGFGEYGVFGHPIGSLHPKIRKVPWAITSAEDKQTYSPEIPAPSVDTSTDQSVDETLEALGYKF